MGKLVIVLVLAVVLVALGGGFFLAFWNPPAPSVAVVKVVPNGRFSK